MTDTKTFYTPAQQPPYLDLSNSNSINNYSTGGTSIGIIKSGTDIGTTTNSNNRAQQLYNTTLDSNSLRQQHISNPKPIYNQNDADTAAGGSNSLANNSFIRRVTSSLDLSGNTFSNTSVNNRPTTANASTGVGSVRNNSDSIHSNYNVALDSSATTNRRNDDKFNLLTEHRRRVQQLQQIQTNRIIGSTGARRQPQQQRQQIQLKNTLRDDKNQNAASTNRTTRTGTIDSSPLADSTAATASTHPLSLQSPSSLTVKPDWRLKDRKMKTVGVGLIMALNLGTDAPDVIKPNPCAVLQCWIDPRPTKAGITRAKAREMIGERLEKQYAIWQLARTPQPLQYRRALDPSVEDVRNLCTRLRAQARNERILIHYNGHGVPRPTAEGGEIWVFDKGHTEYIPVCVTDLRQWMGKPNIVVMDCSSAGVLIPFWTEASILANAAEREQQQERQQRKTGVKTESNNNNETTNTNIPEDEMENMWMNDTILLCPCSEGEWLPMHPDYPADIFTSCLTTPIPIALRWFVRQNQTTFFGYTTANGGITTNNAPDNAAATSDASVSGGMAGTSRSESPNPATTTAPIDATGATRINGINTKSTPLSATSAAAAAAANNTAAIYAMIDQIPGVTKDRTTPLGELNWIFTAITDSIAWNVLPKPLFQRLFRQDLLVASMFRNFLLADRILRSFGCTPITYPPLPGSGRAPFLEKSSCMADHPLWQAWDLACETMLFQLMKDGIIGTSVNPSGSVPPSIPGVVPHGNGANGRSNEQQHATNGRTVPVSGEPSTNGAERQPDHQQQAVSSSLSSPFFSEQLSAFEIWLELASVYKLNSFRKRFSSSCTSTGLRNADDIVFDSPEQLPIVLQVLLSQVHRIRALKLLQGFLDLGPWAVNLALSLGIFPYVMRLLQSPEYKSLLVSIWASILSFDPSCRVDVLKDGAVHHFIQHIAFGLPGTVAALIPTSNSERQDMIQAANERTSAAFILSAICADYPAGQSECIKLNLHATCSSLLLSYEQAENQERVSQQQHNSMRRSKRNGDNSGENTPFSVSELHFPSHFRMWLCLCIASLVKDNLPVQNEAFAIGVNQRLEERLHDKNPDVRAAACYAFGCLIGTHNKKTTIRSPSTQDFSSIQISQQQPNQAYGNMSNAFIAQQRAQPGMPVPNFAIPGAVMPVGGQFNPTLNFQPALGLNLPAGHIMPLQPMMQSGGIMGQMQQFQLRPQQATQQQTPFLGMQQQMFGQPIQGQQMMQIPGTQGNVQQFFSPQQQPHHPTMLPTQVQMLTPVNQFSQPTFVTGNFLLPTSDGSHRPGQLVGLPLNTGQPFLPFSSQNQPFSPNSSMMAQNRRMLSSQSTFDDQNRLELDLTALEMLLQLAITDGSVVVRYEATIALGNAIRKYLDAFVVVAEEISAISTSPASTHRKTTTGTLANLDRRFIDRFLIIWKTMKSLQREDPFPVISKAANTIVSFVHDALLRSRTEGEMPIEDHSARSTFGRGATALTGIDEEPSTDLPSSLHTTNDRGLVNSLLLPKPKDLRRVASEFAGGNNSAAQSMEALHHSASTSNLVKVSDDTPGSSTYTLPVSEFYNWKKNGFNSTFASTGVDEERVKIDPLSPEGIARSYHIRRNATIRQKSARLSSHFASLAPKPPEPIKSDFDMILEKENEDAKIIAQEIEASAKKAELKVHQKSVLRNDGVQRTSLLNFHAYEDYLMVCGGADVVTLWDTKSCLPMSRFENGNPKGSRMTSSFWINEEASSLFLVGCGDGSVKIWSNILESNGQAITTSAPILRSAFYAAPMQADDIDSALVLDWQSYSGRLIAGGSNKYIRCWDLEAEQVTNKIETNSVAHVTTMTTAWENDTLGNTIPSSYSGIGKDIVVTGFSDGAIKIFDLRMDGSVVANEMNNTIGSSNKNQQRRIFLQRSMQYNEENQWIVNTAFTSYTNRYELVCGTLGGEIKAWDLRTLSTIRQVDSQRSPITALVVHKKIPIIATGSNTQFIKLLTLDGDTLQVLRYHEKMGNHRIGPVSCLAFHPNKGMLASGAYDSYIGLYNTTTQYK